MVNRQPYINYTIYPNQFSRTVVHIAFWLSLYLFISYSYSIIFQKSTFDGLVLSYSICKLSLVISFNYLYTYHIFGRLTKLKVLLLLVSFVIWYMVVYYINYLFIGVLSHWFHHPYLAVLQRFYQFRQIFEMFDPPVFAALFSSVVSYSLLAFWIKLLVNFYEELKNETLSIKSHNQVISNWLRTRVRPQFFVSTLSHLQDSLPGDHMALDTIVRLKELMRFSFFKSSGKELIPLYEEVIFMKNYIDLECLRHKGDRVRVVFDTARISNPQVEVSPLLLISFLENAFKHGVSSSHNKSFINLTLTEDSGCINFHIINSIHKPIYVKQAKIKKGGIGLINVKRRLELEYPSKHNLVVYSDEEIFEVTLEINI